MTLENSNSATLLVEDDLELSQRLALYLTSHGMGVMPAQTLTSGRDLLKTNQFQLVLLDLQLGREDGMALLREVVQTDGPPVIVVSARADEADRVLGLELGAYDYVVKPFSFRELLARMRAVIRRDGRLQRGLSGRRLATFGMWTVDLTAHSAQSGAGHSVEFTSGELALLRVFLDHPNRVLWRHELLALTRHRDGEVVERSVDVLIARLRRKIEPSPGHPIFIKTVRGEGYRFTSSVVWETAA